MQAKGTLEQHWEIWRHWRFSSCLRDLLMGFELAEMINGSIQIQKSPSLSPQKQVESLIGYIRKWRSGRQTRQWEWKVRCCRLWLWGVLLRWSVECRRLQFLIWTIQANFKSIWVLPINCWHETNRESHQEACMNWKTHETITVKEDLKYCSNWDSLLRKSYLCIQIERENSQHNWNSC